MSCPLQRTALSSVTGNIPAEGDANAFPPHILAYASLKEAGNDKLKDNWLFLWANTDNGSGAFLSTLRYLRYSWGEAIQWLIVLQILTIWKVYLHSEPCWRPLLHLHRWRLVGLYPGAAVWRYWQHEWLTDQWSSVALLQSPLSFPSPVSHY